MYAHYAMKEKTDILRAIERCHKGKAFLCKSVPYYCTFDSTFVIDMTAIKHRADIKADGLPSWLNRSSRRAKFSKIDGEYVTRANGDVTVKTTYFSQKHNTIITKQIYEFEGKKD